MNDMTTFPLGGTGRGLYLGNTRVVFTGHGYGKPEVNQLTSYDPYGLVTSQTSYYATGASRNKLLYNGKELQDETLAGTRIDWYDYGARFYDPELGRWNSMDPLAEKWRRMSPYNYAANNPVNCIDFNGEYAIYHHYNFTSQAMTKLGYSKATSDLVSHYASVYADNPGRTAKGYSLLAVQGQMYRKGIDYSGTSQSQNTGSAISSSWHSMAADGENISEKDATIRGQQFGWGKIIQAGSEAKKAGGVANLKENSKGMQALGQGLHALQDAQGHRGVNMDNHSVTDDISAPRSNIAMSVTESAVIVTEVLSGNTSHLSSGLTLDVSGISQDQFKVVQGVINNARESQNNINIKFIFNNN